MHLALGGVNGHTVSFRVADYAAYYRMVAREFETFLESSTTYPLATAPEPVEHCGVCRWSEGCRAQWRAEDDLSLFVDLHRAVRQGIRASVESYSIKRLEPLYTFDREIDLRDAGTSIVEFETWLGLGQGDERNELLARIEEYNRDDCLSTMHLRDWLEGQRTELEGEIGSVLPRSAVPEPVETEDSDAQKAVNALAESLIFGLPESTDRMTGSQHGQWLLAQLLNWHRRENKSFWWRYFYLVYELTDAERRYEPDALAELTFESRWADPAQGTRSTIYRFRSPHRTMPSGPAPIPATRKHKSR